MAQQWFLTLDPWKRSAFLIQRWWSFLDTASTHKLNGWSVFLYLMYVSMKWGGETHAINFTWFCAILLWNFDMTNNPKIVICCRAFIFFLFLSFPYCKSITVESFGWSLQKWGMLWVKKAILEKVSWHWWQKISSERPWSQPQILVGRWVMHGQPTLPQQGVVWIPSKIKAKVRQMGS